MASRPGYTVTHGLFTTYKIYREARYKCTTCGLRYRRARTNGWTEGNFSGWQERHEDKLQRHIDGLLAALAESICPCGTKNQRLPEKKKAVKA